jgi:hypothetical protein
LLITRCIARVAIASVDSNVPSYEFDVSQSQPRDFALTIIVSRDGLFSRFLLWIYYQDKLKHSDSGSAWNFPPSVTNDELS